MPKNLSIIYFLLQNVIKKISVSDLPQESAKQIEKSITKLQACIRGYLLRKKISDKLTCYYNNVDKVIKIQAWWRGVMTRKLYYELMKSKKQFNATKIKLLTRKEIDELRGLEYYKKHVIILLFFLFSL